MGLVLCGWRARAAGFDWGQYESATLRAPIDRENAPFVMALAFKVAHGAGCAIRPDKGLCGYVFARACALENTILLAPSQKPPPSPSSRTEQAHRSLPAPSRPTAGTACWIHLVGFSEAPGWCHEASYYALWQVGGSSAAQLERAERRFRCTRTNLREHPRAFTTALPR